MKKLLLTGGTGFIGKNLLESNLVEKYEVFAPKRQELDLSSIESVDNYFKHHEFDILLHTATKPAHRNAKDLNNITYSNLLIFQNIERHRDSFGRLIHFGSGAIYDNSKHVTNVREEAVFTHIPISEYGLAKYIIHKELINIPNSIDIFIFGIFGKYEDYAIRFISNAICKAIFGLPITLRQDRKFSYLDVADLGNILDKIAEDDSPEKALNIVPDFYISLYEIACKIKALVGGNLDIKVAKEGYGLDYYASNAKLKNAYDISFTSFDDSLARLYKYYYDNKDLIDYNVLLEDK